MPRESQDHLTIGDLARLTGVPIKTIRHYSDLGVLPPRRRTGARYRLYGAEDRLRLEVIRLLRSLDFDLETIGRLLSHRRPLRDTLHLQLDAVDAGLRRLRRIRAVLASATAGPDDATALDRLARLHAIAVLGTAERSALLRETMERHLRGAPVDPTWQARLWDAAFAHLPDEPTEDQWPALFELADLVQDPDFGRRLADQARAHWTAMPDPATWQSVFGPLIEPAARAADTGEPLDGEEARRLVGRLVEATAAALGRPHPAARRWLRRQAESHDPRAERFWQLVAQLRGVDPTPPPAARAARWLFAALQTQSRRRP